MQEDYELYEPAGRAQWYEHPTNAEWDTVAIDIPPKPEFAYYPYKFTDAANEMVLAPGADLNIIGFPLGASSDGHYAIWSRATVASVPDLNYLSQPTFLVVLRATDAVHYKNGSTAMLMGPQVQLFGIYSGRISEQSDIGIVWKSAAILGLLEAGRRSERLLDD